MEISGEKGEIIDNPEGRTINPGHSIETSWFLMHKGLHRNEKNIIYTAIDILNRSLERG